MSRLCLLALGLVPGLYANDTDPAASQLAAVKRIYVDRLNGGEPAAQMRDLLIATIQSSKVFLVTENQEKADATLKGSAEDLVFTDTFDTSDSIDGRVTVGNSPSSSTRGTGQSANRGYASSSVGQRDSAKIAERKHEALATVRLVTAAGDVIWSATKESLGGKFRGASADVADKITRQLVEDVSLSRKQAVPKPPAPESAR